ncbi:LLM class flavin-dependent oxidoreductase [Streptomyces sp. NPDC058335]|uniref:LLM class flavin-dependent oxidoreductase n=1 Tax=Streptomyces sp. NPDC058335 TaxID=3346451 RepID=UPI003658B307
MQFGIFTVGDVAMDPATGRTPTEHERLKVMVAIAQKAEEVGLDVFATGEHHNRPFVPSSPTTMLGWITARTERIILSTSTTLITTNDPVKIAEDFAMLQHLADGRVDLMMGRGNTGPVYPWFGKDIRDGISLAVENYALLAACGARTSSTGRGSSVRRSRGSPPPRGRWTAYRRSSGTAAFGHRRLPSRPPTTATGSSTTTSSGRRNTPGR